MSRSYTVVNDDGEAVNRRFFVDRLADFNERFPLKEGWALIVSYEPVDLLALASSSESAKLDKAMLVTAKLENPHGRIVRMASSLSAVSAWKSHESNETNAIARLLELCGIRGELLTDDDQRELARSGFKRSESLLPTGPSAPAPEPASTGGASPSAPAPTTESKTDPRPAPPRVAAPTASERARERDPAGPPAATTTRALQSLARQLGEQIEIPATEGEAKQLMSDLSAKRAAKTNGSGAPH